MNIFPKKLETSHVLFLVIGFALAMLVNKPKVIEGGGTCGYEKELVNKKP